MRAQYLWEAYDLSFLDYIHELVGEDQPAETQHDLYDFDVVYEGNIRDATDEDMNQMPCQVVYRKLEWNLLPSGIFILPAFQPGTSGEPCRFDPTPLHHLECLFNEVQHFVDTKLTGLENVLLSKYTRLKSEYLFCWKYLALLINMGYAILNDHPNYLKSSSFQHLAHEVQVKALWMKNTGARLSEMQEAILRVRHIPRLLSSLEWMCNGLRREVIAFKEHRVFRNRWDYLMLQAIIDTLDQSFADLQATRTVVKYILWEDQDVEMEPWKESELHPYREWLMGVHGVTGQRVWIRIAEVDGQMTAKDKEGIDVSYPVEHAVLREDVRMLGGDIGENVLQK